MSRSTTYDEDGGYECWDCGNRVEQRVHGQLCSQCGGYLRSTARDQPDLR